MTPTCCYTTQEDFKFEDLPLETKVGNGNAIKMQRAHLTSTQPLRPQLRLLLHPQPWGLTAPRQQP